MPKKKDTCDKECKFYLYGPGVERIRDEIENKHKNSKVEILTSDVMSKKNKGETIIKNFENEKIKIIVGTQILAKGHHFPKLTLVIVVDSDIGFFGGDLRAGEKIFQLLMQVAGRSGRSNEKGKVLIQSTNTDNSLFKNLVNFKLKEFFSEELKVRKHTNLPPFKKLCLIMATSENEKKLKIFCNTLKNKIISNNNFEVLGPAPPYISFLRKRFRQRFIVRCSPDKNIQEFIKNWMAKVKIPFGIKTYIDIDPYNFS
jgi:primosomal protein N' (replication factor Y)